MILIESSSLTLDELRTVWNITKPQTYGGMVEFLKKVGFGTLEANKIMIQAGVIRPGRTKRSILASDVAKEANIVPQVLKLLRDQYGLKESIITESAESLTKEEVAAVLQILFQISKDRPTPTELTRISSIESVESRKKLLINEMQWLANEERYLTSDEFKHYSAALLSENLFWHDADLVPIDTQYGVKLEDSSLHLARTVLQYLLT